MLRLLRALYPQSARLGQDRLNYIGWFLTTCALVLFVSALAAIIIAVSGLTFPLHRPFSTSAPNLLTFLGLTILVGAAAFAAGGFLGFLFGVPRVSEGVANPKAPSGSVVSNTNLEQVSDWLTKIVVGVTLVQFHQANDLLVMFRDQVDLAVGGKPNGIHGAGLADCLVLVAASIAGFLAAYLKSKTDLMRAFMEPMQNARTIIGQVIQDVLETSARDVLNRPTSEPDSTSKDAAAKLLQSTPPDTDDADLLRLLGLSQAVLKNFKAAAATLTKAIDAHQADGRAPDPDLNGLAARALALAGETDHAQELTSPPPVSMAPLTRPQIEEGLAYMFTQLYVREGYVQAIAAGERLQQDPEASKSGRLWLYLASAYGQLHAALLRAPNPDKKLVQDARDNALRVVGEALRLDRSGNLEVLRSLWNPSYANKPQGEDDLESLYDDAGFIQLLGPDARV
jgi:tetratricopeptide (TPR) repeat protein